MAADVAAFRTSLPEYAATMSLPRAVQRAFEERRPLDRGPSIRLKRLRLLAHCDEDEFRKRLCTFLQRRGFDYETARATAERLWAERDTLT